MPLGPRSSYYDQQYRQSAALQRARRPYLVKNAVTGLAIFAFAAGVFTFTLRAVGTDEFEDVVVPAGGPIPSNEVPAQRVSIAPHLGGVAGK